ncbi:MAG: cytochrome P450 [Lasallia pustulata]|uniref:Cytochrome P450 n=1 Tax=Lasallia pustulata TaxID=136370 RepID=A0A5M8PXX3_9LECA|nr:MAG: cytochrome P450 [Lasallia pustulata]
MAPWQLSALVSFAASVLLVQLAPQLSISASYVRAFSATFGLQLLIWAVWTVLIYPKLWSPLRHLPHPTNASFFNGHFKLIASETTGKPQQEWINEIPNDGLIRYTALFNRERLLITNSRALGEVLVQKNYDFIKPDQLRQGLGRLLGIGVLLAEGEEHKSQRKNLMPAFAFRHIKDLYPVFWTKSCEMTQAIMSEVSEKSNAEQKSSSAAVEVAQWASRATLDIIGLAGMGHDFNAIQNPNTELSTTYRKVFQPTREAQILGMISLFVPMWIVRALPVQRNDDIAAATSTIRRVCRQLIHQKQEKLDKEERVDIDILSVALESGGFSEENLVDQLMTFLAAGHETTATALTWAIYMMCKHPEIQTRLRAEVREYLPSPEDSSSTVTDKVLDKLPYLHAVCSEVLRVYSPAPLTLREAAKDTSIVGEFVPKGTRIIIAPAAVNLSRELWGDDASKFDPDRWMGPRRTNNGGAESAYAFLTFLHGPRSCIGQAFAKAEFACLLAATVGRFEMELEDKDFVVEVKGVITARPKDGLRVVMKPVEGW